MIQLNSLYKLDTKDNIRTWYIEIEDDKYRVVSGLLEGKKVTADWTVALPKNIGKKNETTGPQQATLEAEALYEKQLNQGAYFESIDDIHNETYFEPMLAEKYKDEKKRIQQAFDRRETVYASVKLDGFRNCNVLKGMYSRNGKPYISSPHISYALIELFMKYPNVVLDGELYNHELHDNFNKLQSLITTKKPKPEDLAETEQKVQYHVYDLYMKDNPNARFSERYDLLNMLNEEFFDGTKIQMVESIPCNSFEDIDAAYGVALEKKYEGQVIRMNTPYENKRTKNLIKRKEFFDAEYTILGIEEGLGNWSGAAKSLLFDLGDGTTFSAGIKGSMEEMTELFNNREKYIGSEATVRYPNLTPDGKPRFGVVHAIYEGKRGV